MLNRSIIMGRITANPELRQTQGGVSVLSFTVAVDSRFTNQNGERQTNFIHCVAWRHTAEFISKYFVKGQMIAVDGSLQSRSYVDKNGNNRSVLELVVENVSFCGSKTENEIVRANSRNKMSTQNMESGGSTNTSTDTSADSFSVGDVEGIEGFEEINNEEDLPF